MQADCTALSLLTPIGGDCGYCKNENSSRTPDSRASYYVTSKSICPAHYQALMDRGWRRSGTLLYLPDPSRSCCPHYTIRLPARELNPIRDHRQAIHRWNRFVLGDKYIKDASLKYPKSKEEKKKQKNSFDLIETVHESEYINKKPGLEPDHRFEVILEPDDFTEEKFALFNNYQRHVHHEGDGDISRAGFKRFLCSSPVHRHRIGDKKLGSFHQMYRLDGRLIAMGVLDLLPQAVSGVYFIYHSDFEKWSFGKLSALREAALAIEADYTYYYMGYYIHSCKKMRYKGDYKPYVLDYDTMQWDILDEKMKALMDKRVWVSMDRERRIEERIRRYREAKRDSGGAWTDEDATELDAVLANELYKVFTPNPVEAMSLGLSVLELGIPGPLSLEQLEGEVDLDKMKVAVMRDQIHVAENLVGWDTASITNTESLKGMFAELAACVGPDVAKEIIIDFRRGV